MSDGEETHICNLQIPKIVRISLDAREQIAPQLPKANKCAQLPNPLMAQVANICIFVVLGVSSLRLPSISSFIDPAYLSIRDRISFRNSRPSWSCTGALAALI